MKLYTKLPVARQMSELGLTLYSLLSRRAATAVAQGRPKGSGAGSTKPTASLDDVDLNDIIGVMVDAVLEAQAAEQTGAAWYERTGERRDYRNGHRVREKLATPIGIACKVAVPRLLHGKLKLPWLGRKMREMPNLRALSAELFTRGMSVSGIADISRALFGSQVSESTISRFNADLEVRYKTWRATQISKPIKYLFLDAIRLRVKRAKEKCLEGVLAAMGITEDGEKLMLDFVWGVWESTATWSSLLVSLKQRGLDIDNVQMVTVDGNAGCIRALRQHFPKVPLQRCWQHKSRNILGGAKNSNAAALARDLEQIREATTQAQADERLAAIRQKWQGKEDNAIKLLDKDWPELFVFLKRAPSHHWRYVRTTNYLERAFLELRRKFNNIAMMPTPESAERLAFGLVDILTQRWQGRQLVGWSLN